MAAGLKIVFAGDGKRRCGECSLCCKLLPMTDKANPEAREAIASMIKAGLMSEDEARTITPDFDKAAGCKCQHQRMKGCSIYARRPFGCRNWSCRWLINDDTGELRRPDRTHYVVDCMPDYVTHGNGVKTPCIQVWVDPNYPEAYRDPALLAFLERRGEEGFVALIRYNAGDGFCLVPPSLNDTKGWLKLRSDATNEKQHKAVDILQVVAGGV
jgi:hypothetical protein